MCSPTGNFKRAYRSVSEVIDAEWLAEGMTPAELERNRRLADIFDMLLATGRSVGDIDAEWAKKTPQEILCEYEALVRPNDRNTKTRNSARTATLRV